MDRADVVEKDQRSKPKIGNRSKILSLRSMIFNRFSGAKETLCGTPPTVVKHQGVKQVISGKYPTHKSQIFIIFKESELKYVLTSKMESRVFSCVEA